MAAHARGGFLLRGRRFPGRKEIATRSTIKLALVFVRPVSKRSREVRGSLSLKGHAVPLADDEQRVEEGNYEGQPAARLTLFGVTLRRAFKRKKRAESLAATFASRIDFGP